MKTALVTAVCSLAIAGIGIAPQEAPPKTPQPNPTTASQTITSITDAELRDILASVPFTGSVTIREEKDNEGLTAFYVYEGEAILLALYQYTDQPGGPVTSLGVSVGNRLSRVADLRRINEWNSNNRYVKAYVDREGDAMLSADLLLSPGVTKLTIREWIRMFGSFSHEFTTFLKS